MASTLPGHTNYAPVVPAIHLDTLSTTYKVTVRAAGLLASLRSLVHRRHCVLP